MHSYPLNNPESYHTYGICRSLLWWIFFFFSEQISVCEDAPHPVMSRLKCLKISLPDAKIWKAIFWQYSKGWRRPRVAAGEDCITKRCAVFFTQCIFHEDGRKKSDNPLFLFECMPCLACLLKKCNSLSTATSFFAKDVFFEQRKSANKPQDIGEQDDKCVPVHFWRWTFIASKMRLRQWKFDRWHQ